jgi:tyrosyl-tRNA synthetase
MLVDYGVVFRYMELLSGRSNEEIKTLRAEVTACRSIIEVKELFAREIVTRFHRQADAEAAIARRRAVAAGGLSEDVEVKELAADGDELWLGKALALAGLAKSSSEGGRSIKGAAVHLDGAVVNDDKTKRQKGQSYLVRVGSKNHRFARLVVK